MMTPPANRRLLAWVEGAVRLCRPADVQWCDGSEFEKQHLCDLMVLGGAFTRLNAKLRPGSYLARAHPSDVARVEDRTYSRKRPAVQLDRDGTDLGNDGMVATNWNLTRTSESF